MTENGTLNMVEKEDAVIFEVHVQPRAAHNEICGLQGNALKIRLTSPPVDGAANKLCTEFVAEMLGISKSRISIVAGDKSRHKKVQVEGIRSDAVLALVTKRRSSR